MRKEKRLARIADLLDEGMGREEIVKTVSEEAGVKPETIEGDIETIEGEESAPALKANPELAKGRVSGGYEVPEGEEGSVHVELEQVRFDALTGEKASRPMVQKYTPRAWAVAKKLLANQGYTHIKVLHEPK